MLLKKIKSINKTYIFVAIIIAIFVATRIPGLVNDNINPDGVNWHWRSEQFMNGIKYQQFIKTYQHYQPGVTLMWIIGPIVELPKQIFTQFDTYSPVTFPVFHFYSKLFLVFVQLTLTFIAFYVLEKLIGIKKAFLTIAIFTLEPFFIGNSRVLHMDVLLTLLLFNGLLFAYWNLKEFDWIKTILAGFFLGLATLTKSVGIGGFLFAAGVGGLYLLITQGIKKSLKYSLPILGVSFLTIFIFFPALWTDAKFALTNIYKGITDKGFDGHGEIFFGKYTRDPGWAFYPVVLLIKSSPFLLVGFLVGLTAKIKNKAKKCELDLDNFLGIFYLGFLFVISIVAK